MRRKDPRFTAVLLSALGVAAALFFLSPRGQERGASAKPLNLRVVASSCEPFAFEAEGEARGLDVDLLSLVCSTRGWTYEIEWVSFDEVFRRLRAGTADMAIGAIYATPERDRDLLLTAPYLRTGLVVVTLPSAHLHGVGDMEGFRIGVKRGATGQNTAESLRISKGLNLTIVPFESTGESLDALLSGRVDAVFNDYLNSVYLISTAYSGKLVIVGGARGPFFLTRNELVYPMRHGLEKERREFDETMNQLRRGGVLDHVREKWLPYKTPVDLRKVIPWSVAGVVLTGLLLAVVVWINRRRVRAKVLRDAEVRTRDLIGQSPMGILIHRSGTVVYANQACLTMFGLSGPDEVISQSIMALAAPSERERLAGFIATRDSGGSAPDIYESVCLRKNGDPFPVQLKVARIHLADGSATLLFVEDITARKSAMEALKKSERDYRGLFEGAHDAIIIFDPQDREEILEVNQRACEVYGFGRDEFVGMSLEALSRDPERGKRQIHETLEGGFNRSFETVQVNRDGSEIAFEVNASVVDFKGRRAILSVNRDITERKRAESELADSERRFRAIFEGANDALFLMRGNTFVDCNPKTLDLYACNRKEIIGATPFDYSPERQPDGRFSREKGEEYISAAIAGTRRSFEWRHLKRNGEPFDAEVSLSALELRGETFVLAVVRDITERKQSEKALRESEGKLRLILENVDEIVYVVKLDATSLTSSSELISGKVQEILGLTPEDFYAKPSLFFELLHPDDKEQLEEATSGILRSLKPGTRYYRLFSRLTEEYRWMEDKIVPLLDEQGAITGFQGVARDVTARRRAEEALRHSEVRFRTLMESANDAIFIAEAETGRIIDANRRAQELVGRNLEELRTMIQAELHPPEEREGYRAIFEKHVGAGSMIESGLYVEHRDGRRIAVDISANVVEIGGRPLVQGIFRDMTGPRKIEAALKESEARFRTLAETTSAAIMIFQDDRFVYINPAAEAMSGYSLKEAQGMGFWTIVHPDHREMVKERGRARQRGEKLPAHYEIEILTKAGEVRWVSLSAGQVLHQGRPAGLVTAFDITERKRAEEDLSRRNLELMSLLASAQAMGGFLDLEAAAKAICQAAITAYGCRMAWIGLVVPESTELRVLASAGHDDGYTEKVRVRWDLSARAQGPCGRAINTRAPVVQRPEDQDFSPWREDALKRGYKAICAIPLIQEDTVRGTLALYSSDPDAFGIQVLSGLEIFARQAAMAVVNAALYEEAKQIIEELGGVNEELMTSRGLVERQLRELQRGRAQLAASESRFRQLAETATAAIFIIRNFRYRYVNAFTEMETGYSREELLAMDSWRLIHPDHHQLVKSKGFVSRDVGAGPTRHELKIVRKNGEVRWLDISVSVIEFEGERSIIGTAYDITDRKQAEQSLQESERRYRELTETVSDWIWEVDDQLRYTYCSPRISDILGYEPSEVMGRRPFDLMPTEEAERLRPAVSDLVKKREEFHILENVNRHKDGSLRILETSAVPIFDAEGRFTGYQGIDRDITERKRIFETLRQSEEEFRRTFDLSPVGAVVVGLDYRFTRCNEAFCRFLGYAEKELAGKTFLEVTHPEDTGIGMEEIRAVADGELGMANFQKRYLRRDGGVVWGELTVRLVPDAKGRPAHFLTIVLDITKRKKAEAALRSSEARLKEIVEHSVNLFYSHTSEHVLTYVSPQSHHFLGCGPEEAMVRWTEFVTDNPINNLGFELTQKAIDTGERQPPYELELRTKDGRTLWVQVNETPVVKDGKTVSIIGAVTDISGLKQAQLALKDTGENLARLRATSPLPVISLDAEGRVLEWNHAAEIMTGWNFEELRGKLCPLKSEVGSGPFEDFIAGAFRNGQANMFLGTCRRKDGSLLSVRITAVSLHGSDGSVSGILAFLTEAEGG